MERRNKGLDSESWEQARALIVLLYNFILIVLWFYFDYMLIHEISKYGLARTKVRPHKYLKRTIFALKVVQGGQCVNLLLALLKITKTNFVAEFC